MLEEFCLEFPGRWASKGQGGQVGLQMAPSTQHIEQLGESVKVRTAIETIVGLVQISSLKKLKVKCCL